MNYVADVLKRHIGRVPAAILASMVLVSLLGAALDACHQPQRPQRPVEAPGQATQGPVPAQCLQEGAPVPASCQGTLPECLQEDGSGPGVMCHWTAPTTGSLWYNDGDESNDDPA